jgi:two-component system cell cycle response regulator DivK
VFVALIIDDDRRNRTLARDVLEAGGFESLEASTGAEGIELAVEHSPDVILLDLRLSDMHGTDVARALAATEATAQIPVVAMSALSLEPAGEWFAAAGFAGSIEKPISVRSFADQVRGFCRPRD